MSDNFITVFLNNLAAGVQGGTKPSASDMGLPDDAPENIFDSQETFSAYFKENNKGNYTFDFSNLDADTLAMFTEINNAADSNTNGTIDGDEEFDILYTQMYTRYQALGQDEGAQPFDQNASKVSVEAFKKSYLIPNEKYLNGEVDENLTNEEINHFFVKNNLVDENGNLDDKAIHTWFIENSGQGEKPYATAILDFAKFMEIADTNGNNSNLDEVETVMTGIVKALWEEGKQKVETTKEVEVPIEGSELGENESMAQYVSPDFKYIPFSTEGLDKEEIPYTRASAKGKIDYVVYKTPGTDTVIRRDKIDYTSGKVQASEIYDETGTKLIRTETYDGETGKLMYASVIGEDGKTPVETYDFDFNTGELKTVTTFDGNGEKTAVYQGSFANETLKGNGTQGGTKTETVTETTYKWGGSSKEDSKDVVYYNSDGNIDKIHRYTTKDGKDAIEILKADGTSTGQFLDVWGKPWDSGNNGGTVPTGGDGGGVVPTGGNGGDGVQPTGGDGKVTGDPEPSGLTGEGYQSTFAKDDKGNEVETVKDADGRTVGVVTRDSDGKITKKQFTLKGSETLYDAPLSATRLELKGGSTYGATMVFLNGDKKVQEITFLSKMKQEINYADDGKTLTSIVTYTADGTTKTGETIYENGKAKSKKLAPEGGGQLYDVPVNTTRVTRDKSTQHETIAFYEDDFKFHEEITTANDKTVIETNKDGTSVKTVTSKDGKTVDITYKSGDK